MEMNSFDRDIALDEDSADRMNCMTELKRLMQSEMKRLGLTPEDVMKNLKNMTEDYSLEDNDMVELKAIKHKTYLTDLSKMASKAIKEQGLTEEEVRKTLGMKRYEK